MAQTWAISVEPFSEYGFKNRQKRFEHTQSYRCEIYTRYSVWWISKFFIFIEINNNTIYLLRTFASGRVVQKIFTGLIPILPIVWSACYVINVIRRVWIVGCHLKNQKKGIQIIICCSFFNVLNSMRKWNVIELLLIYQIVWVSYANVWQK